MKSVQDHVKGLFFTFIGRFFFSLSAPPPQFDDDRLGTMDNSRSLAAHCV